jgi:hypothetical protein
MTDEQLLWIFRNRLSSHNGFGCGRTRRENGCLPDFRCEGQTSIIAGRLKYTGTCGEPCSFICNDADALQKDIDLVQQYAALIDEARSKLPLLRQVEQWPTT